MGRPFLAEHLQIADYPDEAVGPIHVIACQGGVTEAQVGTLLGFPDASFIAPTFGVFASDRVRQIQFALLRNCRDDTATRSAIHRFLDWLVDAGEDGLMVQRARRRLSIVQAIAARTCATAR